MREGPLQIGDVVPYVPYQERRLLRSDVFPRAWFVVQSVSHGEKKVEAAIGDAGYRTYFPMMRKEVRLYRMKKWVIREFPLFNRYVFAELPIDLRHWGLLFRHEAVAGVLGSDGRPRQIDGADIARWMDAEKRLEFDETPEAKLTRTKSRRTSKKAMATRFPVGTRVRATDGPFGGFSGHVTSVNGRESVKAMIEIFNQMVPVEFAVDMVEVVK